MTGKCVRQGRENGFTLLEVMIAVALVAIAVTAVLRLQGQTLRLARMNRFYTEAPLLAETRLAELASTRTPPEPSSGTFADNFSGYTYQLTVETAECGLPDAVAERFKKMEMVITLTEDQWAYTLTTYRMY